MTAVPTPPPQLARPRLLGPPGPDAHPALRPLSSPAPVASSAGQGYWAWVGAHGGAGTTTLAEAVPGGVDLGRTAPWEQGLELPLVVVCRCNARGLAAARTFAGRAPAEAKLLGLVVVADMPERRRPKVLADALYLTAGAYSQVWEMPWVPAWRLGEAPGNASNPRQVAVILRAIWGDLGLPLPGSATQVGATDKHLIDKQRRPSR